MTLTTENILLVGSLLLFVSIIAGKTSYRFGVPTLLLFLTIGMLAGSEGIVGIHFDNPKIAQFIGIIALNFILFFGGFSTGWTSVKPILKEGLILSSLGVLLTAIILGTFVWFVTDFTYYESMLLGSIVSSTDAAAVFSILRSKKLSLDLDLRPTLELESGSNDPMAYILTIVFLTLVIDESQNIISIIPLFLQQMTIGGLAGFGFGKLSKIVINRIKLDYEGLYPALVIALMFITFSATDFVGGNGFLAIYICGIYLGNQDLRHKKTIYKNYDGLAWLMQIVLFLILGLLVFPSQIVPIISIGVIISLFLIIAARPISVFLSLVFFKMKFERRLYISWVGLRGAVPIVFATYPLLAGIEKANMIFNIVFFISVTSVLIQGTSLPIVAKWLNLALPIKERPESKIDKFLDDIPKTAMKEIKISLNSKAVNKPIVELGFPPNTLIAIIKRNEEYITPNGSTIIEAFDVLVVLSENQEGFDKVEEILSP
ncbi:MAG: potassium/proton antiporter [Bacteroidales bacterium]|jgi:cell volume regulation protein A|nr:potassium/proton antiporter [Bacteroidales bacterium]